MKQCVCCLVFVLYFTVCLGHLGDHLTALASKHLRGMTGKTGMLQRNRHLLMKPLDLAKRMTHRTTGNQNLGHHDGLSQPQRQDAAKRLAHAGLEFELYTDLQVSYSEALSKCKDFGSQLSSASWRIDIHAVSALCAAESPSGGCWMQPGPMPEGSDTRGCTLWQGNFGKKVDCSEKHAFVCVAADPTASVQADLQEAYDYDATIEGLPVPEDVVVDDNTDAQETDQPYAQSSAAQASSSSEHNDKTRHQGSSETGADVAGTTEGGGIETHQVLLDPKSHLDADDLVLYDWDEVPSDQAEFQDLLLDDDWDGLPEDQREFRDIALRDWDDLKQYQKEKLASRQRSSQGSGATATPSNIGNALLQPVKQITVHAGFTYILQDKQVSHAEAATACKDQGMLLAGSDWQTEVEAMEVLCSNAGELGCWLVNGSPQAEKCMYRPAGSVEARETDCNVPRSFVCITRAQPAPATMIIQDSTDAVTGSDSLSDEEIRPFEAKVAASADVIGTQATTEAAAAQQQEPTAAGNDRESEHKTELDTRFAELMDEGEIIRDYMWEGLAYQVQQRMAGNKEAEKLCESSGGQLASADWAPDRAGMASLTSQVNMPPGLSFWLLTSELSAAKGECLAMRAESVVTMDCDRRLPYICVSVPEYNSLASRSAEDADADYYYQMSSDYSWSYRAMSVDAANEDAAQVNAAASSAPAVLERHVDSNNQPQPEPVTATTKAPTASATTTASSLSSSSEQVVTLAQSQAVTAASLGLSDPSELTIGNVRYLLVTEPVKYTTAVALCKMFGMQMAGTYLASDRQAGTALCIPESGAAEGCWRPPLPPPATRTTEPTDKNCAFQLGSLPVSASKCDVRRSVLCSGVALHDDEDEWDHEGDPIPDVDEDVNTDVEIEGDTFASDDTGAVTGDDAEHAAALDSQQHSEVRSSNVARTTTQTPLFDLGLIQSKVIEVLEDQILKVQTILFSNINVVSHHSAIVSTVSHEPYMPARQDREQREEDDDDEINSEPQEAGSGSDGDVPDEPGITNSEQHSSSASVLQESGAKSSKSSSHIRPGRTHRKLIEVGAQASRVQKHEHLKGKGPAGSARRAVQEKDAPFVKDAPTVVFIDEETSTVYRDEDSFSELPLPSPDPSPLLDSPPPESPPSPDMPSPPPSPEVPASPESPPPPSPEVPASPDPPPSPDPSPDMVLEDPQVSSTQPRETSGVVTTAAQTMDDKLSAALKVASSDTGGSSGTPPWIPAVSVVLGLGFVGLLVAGAVLLAQKPKQRGADYQAVELITRRSEQGDRNGNNNRRPVGYEPPSLGRNSLDWDSGRHSVMSARTYESRSSRPSADPNFGSARAYGRGSRY